MTTTVLTGRRSLLALLAVFAMVIALLAVPATPVDAATAACPATIPSAGFTDLGGLSQETIDAINCIAFYNISKGTSATTYGPTGDVTRWQMALFLTRQAVAHGVTLPSGADQGFTDLTGLSSEAVTAINQLKQLGITKGTSATTFDPNGNVNRWQMALFITRLVSAAGITLPSGADQGFTDLTGLSTEAVTAINQLAQLNISKGTSATTYDPLGLVKRWQMALFLQRTLDAGGVVPTGLGAFVWKIDVPNNKYFWADDANCKSVEVAYKATDQFFVNGVAATEAAFEAALTALDFVGGTNNGKASPGTGVHNLTTGVKVTSGLVAAVPAQIQEPVSGNPLANLPTGAAFEFYVVDGTATTIAGYNADLSVGDTLSVTGGDGTTAAKAKTFTLTNGSVSGAVANPATITIDTTCQVFDVGVPAGTDAITIGGKVDTLANFNAAITAGDTLVYSYAASKGTWALTNAAPPVLTGEAEADIDTVNKQFDIYTSGTAETANVSYATADWDTIKVNGAVATEADFIAKLTPGDVITWQLADAATTTKSMLALTDAAYSGAPAVLVVGTSLTAYSFGTSGFELDAVDYTAVDPVLGLTLGTGGAVKWQVDGVTATPAQFEAAFSFAAANKKGNVSVAKVGVDIVWNVTTS